LKVRIGAINQLLVEWRCNYSGNYAIIHDVSVTTIDGFPYLFMGMQGMMAKESSIPAILISLSLLLYSLLRMIRNLALF